MDTSYKYYLGVDGGGTKTKFTLCRIPSDGQIPEGSHPYGEILKEYVGSCCHYLQIGYEGLETLLRNGVETVCQDIIDPSDIERVFIGAAGYGDVAADDPKIREAAARAMSNFTAEGKSTGIPFGIGNDCENAMSGALTGKPGINVIAGTGSIACGLDESGGFARCGGWHHGIGGDEGSGYWLAHQLLHEFQRQSDGRDERTALYAAVRKALDLETDDVLITRVVEEWNLDRTRIASLARVVTDLASQQEPYSLAILEAAARELADHAIALKRQLNFTGAETDGDILVSGTGGIFSIGEIITTPYASILADNGMKYIPPAYDPAIGSVLLAIRGR